MIVVVVVVVVVVALVAVFVVVVGTATAAVAFVVSDAAFGAPAASLLPSVAVTAALVADGYHELLVHVKRNGNG